VVNRYWEILYVMYVYALDSMSQINAKLGGFVFLLFVLYILERQEFPPFGASLKDGKWFSLCEKFKYWLLCPPALMPSPDWHL
jgi:hypothetical protein